MPHPGTDSQDGALRAQLAGCSLWAAVGTHGSALSSWPRGPGDTSSGPGLGECVGTLPGSQGSPVGQEGREYWSRRTRQPRARPSPPSARCVLGHPSLPVDRKACLGQSSSRGWHGAGLTPQALSGERGRSSWKLLEPRPGGPRGTRASPQSRSGDGQGHVGRPVRVLWAALSAGRGCHPPSSRTPAGRGRAGTALQKRFRVASAGDVRPPSAAHLPHPSFVSL